MTNEEMILKIKETNDNELFNEFYTNKKGLIGKAFTKWSRSPHFRYDPDELYGLLNMAFFEAFHSFNSDRNVKFTTWFFVQANSRVRHFIRDHPRLESKGYTVRSFDANLKEDIRFTLYDVIEFQEGLNLQDQAIENIERKEEEKNKKHRVTKSKKKSNATDKDREVLKKIKEMIATNAPFMLTINGVSKTIEEWSEECGVSVNVIKMRLRKGWSYDRLLLPPQSNASRKR